DTPQARGWDLNPRPSGYEPDEIPDFSTPHGSSTAVDRESIPGPPGGVKRQSWPAARGSLCFNKRGGRMNCRITGWLVVGALSAGLPSQARRGQGESGTGPLRFRVTLAGPAERGASGRLLIFMEAGTAARQRLGVGFIPGDTWLAGLEVEHLG